MRWHWHRKCHMCTHMAQSRSHSPRPVSTSSVCVQASSEQPDFMGRRLSVSASACVLLLSLSCTPLHAAARPLGAQQASTAQDTSRDALVTLGSGAVVSPADAVPGKTQVEEDGPHSLRSLLHRVGCHKARCAQTLTTPCMCACMIDYIAVLHSRIAILHSRRCHSG